MRNKNISCNKSSLKGVRMGNEKKEVEAPKNEFEVETVGTKVEAKEETPKADAEKPEKNDSDTKKDEAGTENQPKKSRAQKRIEKLAHEKRELAKELKELKEAKADKTEDDDLDPYDFEDYDTYLDAVTENTKADKPKEKNSNQSKADDFQKVLDEIEVKFDDTRDKYEDFDDLVQKQPEDGGPHISLNMVEAINEVDNSGEVAYTLAKDINESIRISKLSPTKQIIAIGKLSDKLLKADEKPEPKVKKVTKAPEPINAIGGGDMVTKTLADAGNFKDYESMREQQNTSRGGW